MANIIEAQLEKVKKLIYLASPYLHASSAIRQNRYEATLKCTSWLVENGFWCISPIVHGHNLACNKDEKISWEWWKEFDTEIITRCDELWVLSIDGTLESKGVNEEVKIAQLQRKRIYIIVQKKNSDDYMIDPLISWEQLKEDAKASTM